MEEEFKVYIQAFWIQNLCSYPPCYTACLKLPSLFLYIIESLELTRHFQKHVR